MVDTLRAEHFEQAHIPGAIHIHFEKVAGKAPQLLADRDAAIASTPREQGWEEAGLPLEHGDSARLESAQ